MPAGRAVDGSPLRSRHRRAALEALAGVAPAASRAGRPRIRLPSIAPLPRRTGRVPSSSWPRPSSARRARLSPAQADRRRVPRRPQAAERGHRVEEGRGAGPLDHESRFRLVLAYVAMAQREWARPELERLVAAAPQVAIYHYWLGRLDYDAGHYAVGGRPPADRRAARPVVSADVRQPRPLLRRVEPDRRGHRAVSRSGPPEPARRGIPRHGRPSTSGAHWLAAAPTRRPRRCCARRSASIRRPRRRTTISARCWSRRTDRTTRFRRCALPPTCDPSYAEPLYALARIYRRQRRAGRRAMPRSPPSRVRRRAQKRGAGRSGVEAVTGGARPRRRRRRPRADRTSRGPGSSRRSPPAGCAGAAPGARRHRRRSRTR